MEVGSWQYSIKHNCACKVIESQTLWGDTTCRGWSQRQIAEYNRERFENLIAAGWDLVIVDEAHRLGGSTDQVANYPGNGAANPEMVPLILIRLDGNHG